MQVHNFSCPPYTLISPSEIPTVCSTPDGAKFTKTPNVVMQNQTQDLYSPNLVPSHSFHFDE